MPKNRNVDITPWLAYPQTSVAKMFDMAPPTFAKRWSEGTNEERRWPHRPLKKLDARIATLLRIISASVVDDDDDATMEGLGKLILEWGLLFQPPVTIRVQVQQEPTE